MFNLKLPDSFKRFAYRINPYPILLQFIPLITEKNLENKIRFSKKTDRIDLFSGSSLDPSKSDSS